MKHVRMVLKVNGKVQALHHDFVLGSGGIARLFLNLSIEGSDFRIKLNFQRNEHMSTVYVGIDHC
jgi:hypothetical protein